MAVNNPLPPLREVIAQHQLAAKKSLGQHFLLDTNLLARIVRSAGNLGGKHVIEIGPGPGGLTRAILESDAAQVTAIEKDRRCMEALAPLKEMYDARFQLKEADAMEMVLVELGPAPRVVIANLPYNVGTALVVQWLEEVAQHGREALESFTVMLQKEVAERMVAEPGSKTYGRLSVLMKQYCDAAIMFDVPNTAFVPPPKVTSSVLHARVLVKPRVDVKLELLEKVVAAAFNQRRKMLRQALKSVSSDAIGLCERAGVDATLRAENCSLEMFASLAKALSPSPSSV